MIVTIRSYNGFYKAFEYKEFLKDWYNYSNNLKTNFQFCKNMNIYRVKNNDVFKDTFAPSFKALRDNVEIY